MAEQSYPSSDQHVDDDATIVKPLAPDLVQEDYATVLRSSEPTPDGEQPELAPGTLIKDRFVIESTLGRGGMGVVYRARDLRKEEAHDRDPYVALKSLSDAFQRDERMVVALQREARKAQTLAHPNIATVYDFDRDDTLVYLTMEQLSGAPMDEFIAEHPDGLEHKRVVQIVRGLCLGLAYAHNKGIVHSDFKPGNVFLSEEDNPKILDFGIARATPVSGDVSASDSTEFDAGELGALTPSYAAIEMFQGEAPHPADDVYALAITTYQLFTGRHPFDSKPAPQAKAEGLTPEPIPGLKRREWRAIRDGLAFDRADRIEHASKFLEGFERASRVWLLGGMTVVLGLILAGYFSFVQIQEQARIAPDIPFVELPVSTQTEVTRLLKEGDTLAGFRDHASALILYREAYQLHPRNADATDKMLTLLEALSVRVVQSNDAAAADTLAQNVNELMAIDGFLGNHERLTAINEALAKGLAQ